MAASVSKSDPQYSLLSHPLYRGIISSYLGPYTEPRFLDALGSLQQAIASSREARSSLPEEAFLIGEWGLTGVCMAYALECVGWVERHERSRTLPPLMPGRPSESIRHLEKLLVLALYQSIGKEVDLKQVTQAEKNRDLINVTAKNYDRLQQAQTGVRMGASFPGPSFYESANMYQLIDQLVELSKRGTLTAKDHFIFTLKATGKPVLDWHVIYVNPALGVIGDAASSLLWKIGDGSLDLFYEVLRSFIGEQNYSHVDATMTALTRGPPLKCRLPLIVSRIWARSATALSIARHSGAKMGLRYVYVIHRNNPLVAKYFPDHTRKFVKALSNFGIGKEFVSFVQGNLHNISRVDLGSDQELSKILYYNSQTYICRGEEEQLLEAVTAIHQLGAQAHGLSCCMQRSILMGVAELLYDLRANGVVRQRCERLIPKILQLRKSAYGQPLNLDEFMNRAKLDECMIPYFKFMIEAGASPSGSRERYRNGMSPSAEAMSSGNEKLIQFFRRYA